MPRATARDFPSDTCYLNLQYETQILCWAISAGSLGFEWVCVRAAWRVDEQANQLKVGVRRLNAIFVVCTRRLCESFCRKWALKCVCDDLIRRGIPFPGGVCEDGAAGGRRACARRLRREPALSSRIRAARGQKKFPKLTFFLVPIV